MPKSPTPILSLDSLTAREQDVLRLMMAGLANRQIAADLGVEVDTVRWYAKQIYSKLGVHSRTEAVLRAQELGFGQSGPAPEPLGLALSLHNLPSYHTLFAGREQELDELSALLNGDQIRLITISGLGGTGKTRLAVEVAQTQTVLFPDGIYFVPLSPIQHVDELETAVARALGLYLTASDDISERLQGYCQEKRILLILDNFEHLTAAAAWIDRFITATLYTNIIVTSRASLNISAEWVRYLEGVDFPLNAADEDAAAYSAVQLFVDRVKRTRGHFSLAAERESVVEICRLVRGLPLAIELAASWAKTLPCAQIAAEIRRSVDFLATTLHDVDPRHRSMRAVFDTSWRLLDPQEQQALQRLSVFRGGFGLAAAEQVAGASAWLIAQLIDKSLLTHHVNGQYEMHELLRQYVGERLSQSPLATLSTRSGKLLAWSKLIQGEFEEAAGVAQDIIARKSGRDAAEEAFGLALSGVLSGMDGDYQRCHQLCTAAMAQTNRDPAAADPVTLFFVNLGLAVAGYSLEDYRDSTHHIRQALRLGQTLHSPAFMTLCLPVTAVILAHEDETERAVQLLGLASARPTQTPTWMENWPLLRELRQEIEDDLGPPAYAALWEKGRGLDLHQTVNGLLAPT